MKPCFQHFLQSLFAEPLSIQSNSVQVLKALWEKTQLKGTHSFETAMIQSTFPHQKVSFYFSQKKKKKEQLCADFYSSCTKTFTIAIASLCCAQIVKNQNLFPCPFPFFALAPASSEHLHLLTCQVLFSWMAVWLSIVRASNLPSTRSTQLVGRLKNLHQPLHFQSL